MSLPERPGANPTYSQRNAYRSSPPRRSRPADIESGSYQPVRAVGHERGKSASSFADTISNSNFNTESIPLSSTDKHGHHHPRQDSSDPAFTRKRSLIRPERSKIDKDHMHYHYNKHAANMDVMPSTTGNDAIVEDMEASTDYSGLSQRGNSLGDGSPPQMSQPRDPHSNEKKRSTRVRTTPARSKSGKISKDAAKQKKRKSTQVDPNARPPSFWHVYCVIVTCWCPGFVLKCFGKTSPTQQKAWREKMGLLSIIALTMAFCGFLTFGFTALVCGTPPLRLQINHVGDGYMIFHGEAYNLENSHHPPADGIPLQSNGLGGNVLYDMAQPHGGQDGSFLFQNVNGKCKGLITLAPGSDVPTNADEDLAWYFPCKCYNQDGSSKPNDTIEYYLGWACHTSLNARNAFYLDLPSTAGVYFSWADVKNSSRNLIVYSGDVLDLDLLYWFNESQVTIPDRFKELRDRSSPVNQAIRGTDVTRIFQATDDKLNAECFSQIIKVGSVDGDTVGCIASRVVLYCALTVILSVVVSRFVIALAFQWFISRNYAASRTSQSSNRKKRAQQIEDWSENIYRAPPRLAGDIGSTVFGSDRSAGRRTTILPKTSRFSTVYDADKGAQAKVPTTMASQGATSQFLNPNSIYQQGNSSRASFLRASSYGGPPMSDGPGPAGFIHDAVVPQPPSDWMPWGFPLAHAMCLVTAYSEGEEGIRTSLDSIATTDYPNSHKVIVVICDGIVKGAGETVSTPDICLGMMKDHSAPPDTVQAFSYVAVATGSKRHNMAKVYSGFYDYGASSRIPVERQQRVPMMIIVKCGTPAEAKKAKPGNRGKRDTQIILMSFLQKVMFDERMTELEYEIFNGLWKVTGISPDYYEIIMMVDADTNVFPDSMTHMVSAMVKDPEVMGLCGETKIANKRESWVTAIQVFEYYVSHHLNKAFESVFGGVTCLPGCFSMYRIKAPKGGQNYWVPILANPDVVEHYAENVVETLHEKNLYLLGEDRYLSTLMLRIFPKRKQIFVPQAVCKTDVPADFKTLLSQRRRWINSTIHNLMELLLVRDLCGTFCFSMQFFVFMDLISGLVLPAAITFTFYIGKQPSRQ